MRFANSEQICPATSSLLTLRFPLSMSPISHSIPLCSLHDLSTCTGTEQINNSPKQSSLRIIST